MGNFVLTSLQPNLSLLLSKLKRPLFLDHSTKRSNVNLCKRNMVSTCAKTSLYSWASFFRVLAVPVVTDSGALFLLIGLSSTS
ncbi:hypothetical protein BVRB_6g150030 [Beta vulgaris subsp. vulgaris]|nr:hypothetical protein BVRB_6g150030 [Beta vulgaris subsp. vulgaris]